MAQNVAPLDVRKNLRLALFKSLIVPLLVLVFFIVAPHWLNSRLKAAGTAAITTSSTLSPQEKIERLDKLARLDFQQVCEDPSSDLMPLHNKLVQSGIAANFQRLHWGLVLSVILVAGLAAALGAIFRLNARAQKSQADLIFAYQWGWRIGMAAALAKVFLLIPLLAYGTFEFSVLLSDHYFPKLLLVIIVGGLFALWRSVSILLKKIPLEFTEPMAREVTPDEAPELWQAVRAAAARLQTSPPDRILVGLQLNFYVTELAVKFDAGRTEGKTLFLSFPALKQLSEAEVVGIIGHELGHFIGEDTKLTREFYPLRLKAHATMVAMARSGWVGWPSFQLLNCFTWCFTETERSASRSRELLADQKAAELTSAQTIAQALIRFQVTAEAFQRSLKTVVRDKGGNPLDVPLQAIVQEELASEPAFWTHLFEKKLPHPLDTHPSLQVRLEALHQTISEDEAKAISLAQSPSAYEKWFAARPALFTGLTQQAAVAVEKIRSLNEVKQADYQTEAGKALLEQHFPEKKWQVKPSAFWGPLVLVGLLSLACCVGVVFMDNAVGRLIFGGLAVGLGFCGFLVYKLRHAELRLNADGLTYTRWLRPLRFSEVQNITGRRQYSNITLTLHFKAKQPRLKKFGLFHFPVKAAGLSLQSFDGKPVEMADTIFRYFTRQPKK
jgi:Zn-dependent protease with chaperone function